MCVQLRKIMLLMRHMSLLERELPSTDQEQIEIQKGVVGLSQRDSAGAETHLSRARRKIVGRIRDARV